MFSASPQKKHRESTRPMDDITEIIAPIGKSGGLYLGNMDAASDEYTLRKLNIDAVLTMCPQNVKSRPLHHKMCPAEDVDEYPIEKHFDESIAFIDEHRRRTNVLVHCQAGISRSATIVIAYLIHKQAIGVREALQFCEDRRWQVYPNNGFLRQLGRFERNFFKNYKQNLRTETQDLYRKPEYTRPISGSARLQELKRESEELERTLQKLKESNKNNHHKMSPYTKKYYYPPY